MDETEEKVKEEVPECVKRPLKSTDEYENEISILKQELESCKTELKNTKSSLADKEEKLDMVNAYHAGLKEQIQSLKEEIKYHKRDITLVDVGVQPDDESDMEDIKTEENVTDEKEVPDEEVPVEEVQVPPSVELSEVPACGPVGDIAESLKETAESALSSSGIVYDEKSGLYYDNSNGYYYNAETSLYYDPKTGTYFYYSAESGNYEFHSQVDLGVSQPSLPQYDANYQPGETSSYYPSTDSHYSKPDSLYDPDSKYDFDIDDARHPYYNTEHQYGDSHYYNTFHHHHHHYDKLKRELAEARNRSQIKEERPPFERHSQSHKELTVKSRDVSAGYRSRSRERMRERKSRHGRHGTSSREVSEDRKDRHGRRSTHSKEKVDERKSRHSRKSKVGSRESSVDRKHHYSHRDRERRETSEDRNRKHKKKREGKKESTKSSHPKHKKEKKKRDKDGDSSSDVHNHMDVDSEVIPKSNVIKKEICSDDSDSGDIHQKADGNASADQKSESSHESETKIKEIPKSGNSVSGSDLESGEVEESSQSSESNSESSDEQEEAMEMDEQNELPEEMQQYDNHPEENIDEIAAQLPPCIRAIVQESEVLKQGILHVVTYSGGTIGREKDIKHCLFIPDSNVSKVHAELRYNQESKEYEVRDLGSQNGTSVNQMRLSETRKESDFCSIRHGDILGIAKTKFLLHIHSGTVTCDECEPGQVLAQIKDKKAQENSGKEKEPYVILSKDEKRKVHRKELKKIKKKFGLENSQYVDNQGAINNPKYMDMADQRRKLVGSDVPGEVIDEGPSSVTRPIAEENKGHKMLSKMGWKEGESLGKDNTGITEPVVVSLRMNKSAGLGSKLAGVTSLDTIPEATRNKKWLQAQQRYEQVKEVCVDPEVMKSETFEEDVKTPVTSEETKDNSLPDIIKDAPIFSPEEDEAEKLLQKKTFLQGHIQNVDT